LIREEEAGFYKVKDELNAVKTGPARNDKKKGGPEIERRSIQM